MGEGRRAGERQVADLAKLVEPRVGLAGLAGGVVRVLVLAAVGVRCGEEEEEREQREHLEEVLAVWRWGKGREGDGSRRGGVELGRFIVGERRAQSIAGDFPQLASPIKLV